MKKFLYTAILVMVTLFSVASCSDENIGPSDVQTDACQFGGPGCPKSGL